MTDLCAEIVRRRDPDRYVAGLLLPPAARPGLWALYAFNYEIARTREVVTDAPLGRIRLQWWRDALDEALRPENPQYRHEILRPLADAVRAHNLPPAMLHALINAREADMGQTPVTGLTGLEDYALATNLPLLHLSALICGENPDDAALIRAAAAYGLVGLLRAHAAHTAQGGHITDSTAVATRAAGLLAGGAGPGVPGVFARIARLYHRRLSAGHGPEAPAFLLFRLLFGPQ